MCDCNLYRVIMYIFMYLFYFGVGTLARVCRCKMSWCDLDLTFDLAIVTLTYNDLSGLYFGNHKV